MTADTFVVHETTELNAYLTAGWVLLATYTKGDVRTGQDQVYCLGWPKRLGDVLRPEVPLSKYRAALKESPLFSRQGDQP